MNPDTVQLPEPRTPLYPLIQQRVAETARPLAERLEAWRMMNSRASLRTSKFNGKPVSYQGVMFDGTPRVVFWGDFFEPFIFEPFIFDAPRQSLEWLIEACRDRHLDVTEYLSEATALLNVLVAKAYEEMARTDQLLRDRGYPDSVAPVHVAHKVEAMTKRILDLAVALTHHGRSAPSEQEISNLRPGLWGVSIDLKAVWRRWFKRAI